MTDIALPELEQLRAIHLPVDPSWWPPAVGWWLLLGVGVVGGWWFYRLWRRGKKMVYPSLEQAIQDELCLLEATFARSGDAQIMLATLSSLLKRVAMAKYGREAMAGLSGQEWANFWQSKGYTLSDQERQWLVAAPYQPGNVAAATGLLALVKRFLLSNPDG